MKRYYIAIGLILVLVSLRPEGKEHINNSIVVAEAKTVTAQSPQLPNTIEPELPKAESKTAAVMQPVTPLELTQSKAAAYGWTDYEWQALEELLGNESGWEIGRINKTSLACGLGQSLPCDKMYPGMDNETIRANIVERGDKWYLANPNAEQEIEWTLGYIKQRYTTPSKALYFWHNLAPPENGSNWY